MIDDIRYNRLVGFIIDHLEGGYYNPQMLVDGRIHDQRYKFSGETMFGIDRKTGGAINQTEDGKNFWFIIDTVNAAYKWPWNYKGGQLENQLKILAGKMMRPFFNLYCKNFLTNDALEIVESDDRLLFHFIYGAWNGAGWSKQFATFINIAVTNGTIDVNALVKIAIDSRKNSVNSLIAQGGNTIEKLMKLL